MVKLSVDDVLNRGDIMVVKLRDTTTKTTRVFTVEGEFLKKVMEYQSLRTKKITSKRFFINYRDGRCTNQAIGKNKLGGMPREVAEFLKLPNPEQYTGNSFRKSSAILCANQGKIQFHKHPIMREKNLQNYTTKKTILTSKNYKKKLHEFMKFYMN